MARRQSGNSKDFSLQALLPLACMSVLSCLLFACGKGSSSPSAIADNTPPPAGATCTIFASANGNDANSGATPFAPRTLLGAAALTKPGSVVCLLAGTYQLKSTFYPPAGGTPSAWITYKDYGDGDVNLVWTGGPNAADKMMFKMGSGTFPSAPAYLQFQGLKLDGQTYAIAGFFCFGAHHLRFAGNTITNTGGAGISTVLCDYITSDSNIVYRNGYRYGWTSGISYNSSQWFDRYQGFHNIISNNFVAGEYDGSGKHTDGNGIILDLSNRSYRYGSANTPPALIINNVVYGNGGRCVHAFVVSNFWVVNNTCYQNGLDLALGYAPSFSTDNSRDGYFVNNIAVAWGRRNEGFAQFHSNANIRYFANLSFGSPINSSHFDPVQFFEADPLFLRPPQFDPVADGQYAAAPAPWDLADGLALRSASPALRRGVDPSALPNVPPAIAADLQKYIYRDIRGKQRLPETGFDLGAYQLTAVPSGPTRTAEAPHRANRP